MLAFKSGTNNESVLENNGTLVKHNYFNIYLAFTCKETKQCRREGQNRTTEVSTLLICCP